MAHRSILIEGYRIGPPPVLSALAQAEAAGVRVRKIAERGQARYAGAIVAKGSQGVRDPNYTVDRPEVVVIDKRQVIKVFFAPDPARGRNAGRTVASLFAIRDRDLALSYADGSGATAR